MDKEEKHVFYEAQNTYSTLNKRTEKTENTWFVCHGLGYLSRYFIKYFEHLDPVKNYIIAPQAPSKYYQSEDFKHIGASWLTRENTQSETKNVMAYFDAIAEKERIFENGKKILFGFSQGVSVALRWMASRQIDCDFLVIYAGGIPVELTPKDFAYLRNTKVKMIYGDKDRFITPERLGKQIDFAKRLFGEERIQVIPFKGKHEMRPEVITQLVE